MYFTRSRSMRQKNPPGPPLAPADQGRCSPTLGFSLKSPLYPEVMYVGIGFKAARASNPPCVVRHFPSCARSGGTRSSG